VALGCVTKLHILVAFIVPSTSCTCVMIILFNQLLICHTCKVDGLSWQRRTAYKQGCKQNCAHNLREISFLCIWNISGIFYFSLRKMGPILYMLR
jgi:hypothetical protein